MKKLILSLFAFGIISTGISQAVSDRTTVPLAVNLNQVLRLNIMQGGNLEFTFNTIADYENGINKALSTATPRIEGNPGANTGTGTAFTDLAGTPVVNGNAAGFYITQFTVASSNNWEIHMGAEDADLKGTDATNTMLLDNIGYSITADGTHKFVTGTTTPDFVLESTPTTNGTVVNRLYQFPGTAPLVQMTLNNIPANEGNAGDIGDNSFSVYWRVGTSENGMNQVALINQNLQNDRYVTNVLFDLQITE